MVDLIDNLQSDETFNYGLVDSARTDIESNSAYDRSSSSQVMQNDNFERQINDIDISIESKKRRVPLKNIANNQKSTKPIPKSRKRSKSNMAPVSRTTRSRTKDTVNSHEAGVY